MGIVRASDENLDLIWAIKSFLRSSGRWADLSWSTSCIRERISWAGMPDAGRRLLNSVLMILFFQREM